MYRRNTKPQAPETELLDRLLTAPVPAAVPRLQAVALESLPLQRRRTLSGYLLRNWFDRALTLAERTLAVGLLGFFGWSLAAGYGYDLWHDWTTPVVATTAQSKTSASSRPQSGGTPGTIHGIAVRSTSTLTTRTPHAVHRPAGAHPDLGRLLPVAPESPDQLPGEDWRAAKAPRVHPVVMPPEPTAAPSPTISSQPVPVVTPEPAPVVVDRRPTHILAPSIGLDAPVVEVFLQNGVWQVAEYAVGFLHDTGSAGESNLVMAGHKGIRGSVFSRLEQLQTGQELWVDTAHDRYHYRVDRTLRVLPTAVDVLYPTDTATLTLMTCTNWDTQRFVVRASLIDSAPLPAGN